MLPQAKAAARLHAAALRSRCDPGLGAELARHALDALAFPAKISGYWPMGSEIDIRPLLHALHRRGHMILLPQTPARGNPLIFRHWQPDAPMIAERFGTARPDGPVDTPELLLIPLLAFDRSGHRLGYGGGFYDRTLAMLPQAIAIGCAYAAQQLDSVPAGPYDARLHAVATEHGILRTEGI